MNQIPQGYVQQQGYVPQQQGYTPQQMYIPQQQGYTYQQPYAQQPQASVGAVNIQIYNPTVSPGGVGYYPYYVPTNIPAQPAGMNQNINQNVTQQVGQQPQQPPVETPQQPAAAPINENKEVDKKEEKKDDKKKQIVPLTDAYIKTLENYLNNQNADVRLMGAKELLNRFKEDESRKGDIALTNLLNKCLRDPSQSVRLLGLATLEAGYAYGDDLTVKILKDMQSKDTAYNQDALTASQVLLKMAGKKIDVSTENAAQPVTEDLKTGQNLNLMSV